MIDFHSHILPNIDDGSRSYEESKIILSEAKNAGFDKVISTSHYALNCFETPEYKREDLIEELNSEKGLPTIILGSEIFLNYTIVDLLKEYKASTINKTNYVLFELPLRHQFPNLKITINKLKENNYIPILAHPERYSISHKKFDFLLELKDMGVIFQANYGSILGMYGFGAKLTVKKMFKNNLVNLLGSDVHRPNSIYPNIEKALDKISRISTPSQLDDMTCNTAESILRGEYL